MTKMARQLAPLLLAAASGMDCGDGVHLCGVIVLEGGQGPGNYHHERTAVHGIWPQTGSYGTSSCIAPTESSDQPTSPLACYEDLGFQQHEWGKHGVCAGVKNAADFFNQVCSLAAPGLALMEDIKESGGNLGAMEAALTNAGYPITELDTAHSQIYLSCCSGPDGQWKIAAVEDFPTVCPWGSAPVPAPQSTPAPSPSPHGRRRQTPAPSHERRRRSTPSNPTQCLHSQHGPRCSNDDDCTDVTFCVRCARSGYCTDVAVEMEVV